MGLSRKRSYPLLRISIFRNCFPLEFHQNIHPPLEFPRIFHCFLLSPPGISSKLSRYFSYHPLEFSKFKPPWNSVVLNREGGGYGIFLEKPIIKLIFKFLEKFMFDKWILIWNSTSWLILQFSVNFNLQFSDKNELAWKEDLNRLEHREQRI